MYSHNNESQHGNTVCTVLHFNTKNIIWPGDLSFLTYELSPFTVLCGFICELCKDLR